MLRVNEENEKTAQQQLRASKPRVRWEFCNRFLPPYKPIIGSRAVIVIAPVRTGASDRADGRTETRLEPTKLTQQNKRYSNRKLGKWVQMDTAYDNVTYNKRSSVKKTRRPTNWWGSAYCDVTHPTATVIYNACYHWFRKRSCITVHRLAWVNWPRQQYDTSHLFNVYA